VADQLPVDGQAIAGIHEYTEHGFRRFVGQVELFAKENESIATEAMAVDPKEAHVRLC
jgi:hypothetical protein